jgi:hypothetical protein
MDDGRDAGFSDTVNELVQIWHCELGEQARPQNLARRGGVANRDDGRAACTQDVSVFDEEVRDML